VLSGSKNFVALHLNWCLFFIASSAAAFGWYFVHSAGSSRWPGGASLPGLVFGLLAGAIIVFECALYLRKTRWFRTRRFLGRAQLWMKAHIWLGLLSAPLVLLHSGFQFGGWLTFWLAWIFIVVIASGVLGLVIQNFLPRLMLEEVPAETVGSQIETVARQYVVDAEQIVALTCGDQTLSSVVESQTRSARQATVEPVREIGARRRIGTQVERSPFGNVLYPQVRQAGELRRAFDVEIRPYLETGWPKAKLGSPRRDEEYFSSLRKALHPDAHAAVSALQVLCTRRHQLNIQGRLQLVLQGWLLIHLPLSLVLLMLLIVHAYFALRFA
jgi:hypothetical protein